MNKKDIPFSRPFIGRAECSAVLKVLRSRWLTTGAETAAFEKEFSDFIGGPGGGPGALAVNSATSGLHLALEACGIGPGDAVFCPSYTFAATAEVARYLGAEVVFVDVAEGSFLLDAEKFEQAVKRACESGKRPAAVVPVHYGGLPCDMEPIIKTARRYSMFVVEDAAHALPSYFEDGRHAGTAGDAGVFSFYATKPVAAGEGGMVISRSEALISRMSLMRLHGIDRPVWNRYSGSGASWYYEVEEAGFKYNLCDILSAIGRVQLRRALSLWDDRKKTASLYDRAFRENEKLIIPPSSRGDARHLYPLRLNQKNCGVSRDDFIEKLREKGIGVSVHFIPLHTMPYYERRYGLKKEDFPQTMVSFQSEISLPLWPGMKKSQIERVIKAVNDAA